VERKTGPGRDRRCCPTILWLCRFLEQSSWPISSRCGGAGWYPKARAWSSAHCDAAFVSRALGRDVAGGLRNNRGLALVAQTQFAAERRIETKLLLNMREDQMASILNEPLEWLDRAEQAREVAGQLTDPSARNAVLELAQHFDRLARAAAAPTAARRRELAMKDQ
jgi:hypothetical protein